MRTFYNVIRNQFRLKDWTLVKTFGTSIAVGTAGLAVAYGLGYTDQVIKPQYTMANLIGGAIVGAGAYMTGSSPEAAVAQVGAGKRKAVMTVLGGFTGVLTYGLFEKYLRDSFLGAPGKLSSINGIVGLPFTYAALGFAALVAGAVFVVESLYPTESVEAANEHNKKGALNYIHKYRWSPYAAGAVIGALQVPISIFMTNMFGVTSTYALLAGHVVALFGVTTTYFVSQSTPDHFWLVPLHFGSALGSFIAENESKDKVIKAKTELTGGQLATAFAGGLAMTVGSAIANGSPSVHGLSGICNLSTGSLIATLAMFGGGVIAAKVSEA